MDPITLVVSALAAGASSGLTGAAGQAITDAYNALKGLLRRRLSEKGQDPAVVDKPDTSPEDLRAKLEGPLSAEDIDDEIRAAAQQLLAKADPAGAQVGKYNISFKDSKGVTIGDGVVVHQTFN